MSQNEEEKLHREKWKLWNEQRERQQIKKKLNVEEGIENYAANLIQKMNDPMEKNKYSKQQNKELNK